MCSKNKQKKDPIVVTPRKSWSPGYLSTQDVDRFLRGELTYEELQKIEAKRKNKIEGVRDTSKMTKF